MHHVFNQGHAFRSSLANILSSRFCSKGSLKCRSHVYNSVQNSTERNPITTMAATDGVTVHNIADRGDVILLVGVPPRAKIRVFSLILTAASPIFAAMLGPHFREGQGERSAESPKGIALPDDDPTAMTAMCRLLHFLTPQDFMDDPRSKKKNLLTSFSNRQVCLPRCSTPAKPRFALAMAGHISGRRPTFPA